MNRIPLSRQEYALREFFPGSKISRDFERSLVWIHTLTPTSISSSYKVKLRYRPDKGLDFYVLEPKLQLADGETELPHVYSTEEQRLCLYDPELNEWSPDKYYVHTIIPWASEWLSYYEVWVVTGDWNGGGSHPKPDPNEQENWFDKAD